MMWKLNLTRKPISWLWWWWGELHVWDSVSEKTRQLGWLCNCRDVNSIRHDSAAARTVEWRSSSVHIFFIYFFISAQKSYEHQRLSTAVHFGGCKTTTSARKLNVKGFSTRDDRALPLMQNIFTTSVDIFHPKLKKILTLIDCHVEKKHTSIIVLLLVKYKIEFGRKRKKIWVMRRFWGKATFCENNYSCKVKKSEIWPESKPKFCNTNVK